LNPVHRNDRPILWDTDKQSRILSRDTCPGFDTDQTNTRWCYTLFQAVQIPPP
jgi:hypothetical protein